MAPETQSAPTTRGALNTILILIVIQRSQCTTHKHYGMQPGGFIAVLIVDQRVQRVHNIQALWIVFQRMQYTAYKHTAVCNW